MTNVDLFNTFVKKDWMKVNELIINGCTETTEFKESLEALNSSVEAMLMDMDLNEKGELYA